MGVAVGAGVGSEVGEGTGGEVDGSVAVGLLHPARTNIKKPSALNLNIEDRFYPRPQHKSGCVAGLRRERVQR